MPLLSQPHGFAQAPQGGAYTLAPVAYGMQLKTPDGRVVFEYMTKKPPMSEVPLTSPSVACFHPVLTPSGERVTALAPDDHPHHRGIYLAWHDSEFRTPIDPGKMGPYAPAFGWGIARADFWGWGEYAPRENRIIQNTSIKLANATAQQARIELQNDWMVGKRKLLQENTVTTVSERDGSYVIDFTFTLAPVVDYVLNKQSFSGFNLQARKDGESYYTNSSGTVNLPNRALFGSRAELAAFAVVWLRHQAGERQGGWLGRDRSSVEPAEHVAHRAESLDAESGDRRARSGHDTPVSAAHLALPRGRS